MKKLIVDIVDIFITFRSPRGILSINPQDIPNLQPRYLDTHFHLPLLSNSTNLLFSEAEATLPFLYGTLWFLGSCC